jgi:hypothetical protein
MIIQKSPMNKNEIFTKSRLRGDHFYTTPSRVRPTQAEISQENDPMQLFTNSTGHDSGHFTRRSTDPAEATGTATAATGTATAATGTATAATRSTRTGARFTNFQELFLTRILNAILNRLRIDS